MCVNVYKEADRDQDIYLSAEEAAEDGWKNAGDWMVLVISIVNVCLFSSCMMNPQWYYVKMQYVEVIWHVVSFLGFLILFVDSFFIGLQKKLYKGPFHYKKSPFTDNKAEDEDSKHK